MGGFNYFLNNPFNTQKCIPIRTKNEQFGGPDLLNFWPGLEPSEANITHATEASLTTEVPQATLML